MFGMGRKCLAWVGSVWHRLNCLARDKLFGMGGTGWIVWHGINCLAWVAQDELFGTGINCLAQDLNFFARRTTTTTITTTTRTTITRH